MVVKGVDQWEQALDCGRGYLEREGAGVGVEWCCGLVEDGIDFGEEVGVSSVGDGRCCVTGGVSGVYCLIGKHGVGGEEAQGAVGGSGKCFDGDVSVTYPDVRDVGGEEV